MREATARTNHVEVLVQLPHEPDAVRLHVLCRRRLILAFFEFGSAFRLFSESARTCSDGLDRRRGGRQRTGEPRPSMALAAANPRGTQNLGSLMTCMYACSDGSHTPCPFVPHLRAQRFLVLRVTARASSLVFKHRRSPLSHPGCSKRAGHNGQTATAHSVLYFRTRSRPSSFRNDKPSCAARYAESSRVPCAQRRQHSQLSVKELRTCIQNRCAKLVWYELCDVT